MVWNILVRCGRDLSRFCRQFARRPARFTHLDPIFGYLYSAQAKDELLCAGWSNPRSHPAAHRMGGSIGVPQCRRMDSLRNAFSLAIPSLHVDRLDVQRGLCPGGVFDASARAMERPQHGLAESATGTGINSYLFDTSPVGSDGCVLCRFGSSAQFGILL